MLALAVHLNPFTTRRDRVGQRRLIIQLLAHLIEVRDLQLAALLHRAGIRRFLAEDQAQQRGLAGAVHADQADLVAAHDGRAEILHDRAAVV